MCNSAEFHRDDTIVLLCAFMLNAISLCHLLIFILKSVILLSVILLNEILYNANQLSVAIPIVILLSVVLSVILLNII